MKTLICPVSPLRVKRSVVRIIGFMMESMIAIYALTGNIYFVAVIVLDYFIRVFIPLSHSPFSWLADQVATLMRLPANRIDKAPKIFAARVGFLFALSALVLYPIQPTVSLLVALTLMGFALLEEK